MTPKVEGQGKRPYLPPRNRVKRHEFKAPTYGYEHMIFRQGTAKDAALYTETKRALAKVAGTTFKVGGNMAARAIDKLEEPVSAEPEDPPPEVASPTIDQIKAKKRWEYEIDAYYKSLSAWKEGIPTGDAACPS